MSFSLRRNKVRESLPPQRERIHLASTVTLVVESYAPDRSSSIPCPLSGVPAPLNLAPALGMFWRPTPSFPSGIQLYVFLNLET